MIVTLKNGFTFNADSVVRSTMYPVLHIYTSELTFATAGEAFSDPQACREISVSDGENPPRVYHNFTVLYSIQKAGILQNPEGTEILIWMNRPEVDYD